MDVTRLVVRGQDGPTLSWLDDWGPCVFELVVSLLVIARGIRYRMNRRPTYHRPLTVRERAINRARSRTRARGEHPFHVVKRLWGFAKVRYRGLAKNLARAWMMFALANLYMVRRQLLPAQARCVL